MGIRIARLSRVLGAPAALMMGAAACAAAVIAPSPSAAATGAACQIHHFIAYVATVGKAAVTPLDTVTGAKFKPIPVHGQPEAVAITPDGGTAYVVSLVPPGMVTVIRTRTGTVVKTFRVPGPQGMGTYIAITPDGKTVYVSLGTAIVPIRTADNKVFKPILTGLAVTGMIITPDSRKLYANTWNGKVLPVSTATNTAGKPISLPSYQVGVASGIALTPDGKTLYSASGNVLLPISTATDNHGRAIRFAEQIDNIVISKDGRTGWVSNMGSYGGPGKVFPVNLVTGEILAPIVLPGVAGWMLLTPDGTTLYALEQLAGTMTAIRAATGTVLGEIKVKSMPAGFAVTPGGRTVFVLDGAKSLTPVSTATNRARAAIPLIGGPTGIAFFWRC
jgi:DNA-binding beta-propeller fold protein YncE